MLLGLLGRRRRLRRRRDGDGAVDGRDASERALSRLVDRNNDRRWVESDEAGLDLDRATRDRGVAGRCDSDLRMSAIRCCVSTDRRRGGVHAVGARAARLAALLLAAIELVVHRRPVCVGDAERSVSSQMRATHVQPGFAVKSQSRLNASVVCGTGVAEGGQPTLNSVLVERSGEADFVRRARARGRN